jgi:hypothetical protein
VTEPVIVRPDVEPVEPFLRTPRLRLVPLIAVGVLAFAGALVLLLGDGILTQLLGVIIALLLLTGLALIGAMFEWPRRGRLTVIQHEAALVVPPVPVLPGLGRAAVLLAVLFGVPSVISLATGEELATMFRFTALGVAALAVGPCVRIWSGRETFQSLRLDSDGLTLGAQTVAWHDVLRVELLERPAIVIRVLAQGTVVKIPTSLFACDPALLCRLIKHLSSGRRARADLGTPAMLERLQRGDF